MCDLSGLTIDSYKIYLASLIGGKAALSTSDLVHPVTSEGSCNNGLSHFLSLGWLCSYEYLQFYPRHFHSETSLCGEGGGWGGCSAKTCSDSSAKISLSKFQGDTFPYSDSVFSNLSSSPLSHAGIQFQKIAGTFGSPAAVIQLTPVTGNIGRANNTLLFLASCLHYHKKWTKDLVWLNWPPWHFAALNMYNIAS